MRGETIDERRAGTEKYSAIAAIPKALESRTFKEKHNVKKMYKMSNTICVSLKRGCVELLENKWSSQQHVPQIIIQYLGS